MKTSKLPKNKLPRKRKKAMIKTETKLGYIAAMVANEMIFERDGKCDFRFPKFGKVRGGQVQILGYY